ncbi:helix-turn-helix transcriptional regulator [Streptomyces netropsis]|uniref:helix-turn-helix transcriptional regulator n=1 Tax=Streptomyces netropsis TaxID=55404 RepID=UPI0037AB572E
MDQRAELGTFLRSRRARIKPEDTGLTLYGERRRVPGLRREELAQLAGVSVDYYTRFEQGRADNVSNEIVDAVATALRLGADERTHLHHLVRAVPVGARGPVPAPPPQEVRPGVRRLLETMSDTPACVIGRGSEFLAWNPLYAALVTDPAALPPERRNKLWLFFCDDEVRGRFTDPRRKAECLAANFRMDMGRHPGDPRYAALVERLSAASEEFRDVWADQDVSTKRHGSLGLRHPAVGEFTLSYEALCLTDPDQLLITYTAEKGSASEAALGVLAEQVRAAGGGSATPESRAAQAGC